MTSIQHQLQEVITRMTHESSQKDDTVKNLSVGIATLSSSVATKDRQIADLETIRDRLTAQVKQQDQMITNNTADLNTMNRQMLGVDTENALLKNHNREYKREIDDLTGQLHSMQLLIEERDNEIAENAIMVSQLHQRIAALEKSQVHVHVQQPSAASTSNTQQIQVSSPTSIASSQHI